ncbi:hypothetical protein RQP53_12220 [Paucibacter sp. APW11]|uniref:Solute-binding protein family 3/N-terminal domain-containing protein n=1 Tax=Roseateles aquae TaxID=3077235 RepID=A0ABU3PBU1_9BURK|nr:hypothetical protein [Paucibacter sp. APW11]MDT9000032.1 hypothetical protein [Paucibacter sp. APW11]
MDSCQRFPIGASKLLAACARWRRRLWLALLLLAPSVQATERLPLYTYYVDPPFDAVSAGNLTVGLAEWLSQRSAGRYLFIATPIQRQELERMLAKPAWHGVLAWANPHWLGADKERGTRWTAAFMQDADLVVSRATDPADYLDGGLSLAGRTVCSLPGHRLPDLEWLIAAGKVRRVDAPSELACLQLLHEGGTDVALLQAATLNHFKRRQPSLVQGLLVAARPRLTFARQLGTARESGALHRYLESVLPSLAEDATWSGLLPRPPRQLRLVSMVPSERSDAALLRKLFDQLFERAGLSYSLAWRPAERAMMEFRAGDFDGDMGRLSVFAQSYPGALRVDPAYAQTTIMLLTPSNSPPGRTLESFKSLRLGVPNGYRELDGLSRDFSRRLLVLNPLTCARMVARRHLDACLVATDVTGRWIGEKELVGQLQAEIVERRDVYLWLAPGLEAEASALGRAMSEMKRSGELQALLFGSTIH